MFRLPIARSGALVTATVATRAVNQQGMNGNTAQSDQKIISKGTQRANEAMRDKEQPVTDANEEGQQGQSQMKSKTSNKNSK
jgi:hypothetical protein